MTSNGRSESPSRRLDSWTEIAEYLGRSSRTVQRWHADYHLPIHRLGSSKGSLFAYTNELDTWMWSRGQEESAQKISSHRPVLVHTAPAHTEATPSSDEGTYSDSHGITKNRSADLVGVAQRLWETLSHTNIETMARLFRQAIDLDPSNADAYAGLALAFIVEGLLDDLPMRSATASAQAALTRALEIDPCVPGACCAESWLRMILDRDWEGARKGFDQDLKRGCVATHAIAGRALLHVAGGTPEKASELILRGARDYPLNTRLSSLLYWTEYLAGRFSAVCTHVKEARVSGSSDPVLDAVEAMAFIQIEEPHAFTPRIEALAMESPDHDVLRGALGYAYAAAGQPDRARHILRMLIQSDSPDDSGKPYAIALIFIGLNERQKASHWLERSYNEGSLWSFGFPTDPMLACLRSDPYFRLFWSKVNYPLLDAKCADASCRVS